MSVSPDFLSFVLEQFEAFAPVSAKRMFGGVGLYRAGVFFALIENDTLRLKVDDSNRRDFERKGMGPFRPFGDKPMVMQYYEVPAEILEDADQLASWASKAYAVALRAAATSRKVSKTVKSVS